MYLATDTIVKVSRYKILSRCFTWHHSIA